MAAFQKFHSFVEAVAESKHDLGSDTLKVILQTTLPMQQTILSRIFKRLPQVTVTPLVVTLLLS